MTLDVDMAAIMSSDKASLGSIFYNSSALIWNAGQKRGDGSFGVSYLPGGLYADIRGLLDLHRTYPTSFLFTATLPTLSARVLIEMLLPT